MFGVIEKVILLQNVSIFLEVSTQQLSHLAAIAEEVSFPKGTEIYREADPADAMYLVLDGQVQLQRDGLEVEVSGSKEVFGTWALFDDAPRVGSGADSQRGLAIMRYGAS